MGRPIMMWTWQDVHVEDERRTQADLRDIAEHGFAGVMIQLRGCRYAVTDPAVRQAVVRAVKQARALKLLVWVCLDPRLAASDLKRRTGEAAAFWIVAHADDDSAMTRAKQALPVDTETEIGADGRIGIRLRYPARRPHHMHSDGALHFVPWRLDRVFAYQKTDPDTVVAHSVTDITQHCRLWVDQLTGAVEVFGRWSPAASESGAEAKAVAAPGAKRGAKPGAKPGAEPGTKPGAEPGTEQRADVGAEPVVGAAARPESGRPWYALAFVLFDSNYPEFAGAATRRALVEELAHYAAEGVVLDGICWDEPGYATAFDPRFRADRMRLPGGDGIRDIFFKKTGIDLMDHLYLLVRHDDEHTALDVRRAYYESVQEAVLGFQEELGSEARRLFGPETDIGIHSTWHQNADDLIHGSGDWWEATRTLTGGFTDVGSAEELDRPEQVREIISMLVMAGSLARHSSSGKAWINLWGVDFGQPGGRYPGGVVDYWAALMAVFGTRWLAHIYGPTSYFHRPNVWGPGYPHHPTWERFPRLTDLCDRVGRITRWRPPVADVLVVWPLESMLRLGGPEANVVADRAKAAVVELVDHGLAIHVISPRLLTKARVDAGRIVLGNARYRGVVCLEPGPSSARSSRSLAMGFLGHLAADKVPILFWDLSQRDADGVAAAARRAGMRPLIEAPSGAYANVWRSPEGTTVAVCPQRFGQIVVGTLKWEDGSLHVSPTNGLLLAHWDNHGRLIERIEWRIDDTEYTEERTTVGER